MNRIDTAMQCRRVHARRRISAVHLASRGACVAVTLLLVAVAAAADDTDVSVSMPTGALAKLHLQFQGAAPAQLLEKLQIQDIAKADLAVPVRLRDGVQVAATVVSPRAPAATRLPVILIRTPYNPTDELGEPLARKLIPELLRNGYVIVVVNDRGTQWSEGSYHWVKGANRDGTDILNWIVKQPWSNGKVGMFGCSSSAESQPPLATLNHPALKAMVEMAGLTGVGNIPGYRDQGIFYHGGVPDLSWTAWYIYFGHLHHPQLPPDLSAAERAQVVEAYSPQPIYNFRFYDPDAQQMGLAEVMSHLPSEDILRAIDSPQTEWERLIRLSPGSPEWSDYDFVRERDKTTIPTLHIDSWYDGFEAFPMIKFFEYLSRNSPNQRLLMGATSHCHMGSESERTVVGDREVGDARFDYVSTVKGWFDEWLKGISPPAPLPVVQYYVLNSSHWQSASAWPPPEAKPMQLYFSSGGHANSLAGDGRLVAQAPTGSQGIDRFVYDPMNPVPSPIQSGSWSPAAAREQSAIESRQDVLVYTTDAYAETLRIVGEVDVALSVSTSVVDTDLMAKLVDVYPDGRAYNLTDSALRLRYRDGVEKPTLMQPGKIYDVVLHGMVTATDILPGHRLRVEIASSSFPNYERNLNTGGRNYDETATQPATTQIHHQLPHASFIKFDTLPAR
jgi:putative CocE/NonD family hydrolase